MLHAETPKIVKVDINQVALWPVFHNSGALFKFNEMLLASRAHRLSGHDPDDDEDDEFMELQGRNSALLLLALHSDGKSIGRQPSDLARMQSSRVEQWKTYTQTDRQAQWDTQTGSRLQPV